MHNSISVTPLFNCAAGVGEVTITFLGPATNDFLGRKVFLSRQVTQSLYLYALQALDILATYLTSSAVAPLNKEFVEIESPLWSVFSLFLKSKWSYPSYLSTYIYFSEDIRATRVYLPIYIGSIPAEHLDAFDQKLKTTFQRIANEGIDMERMAMVINRDERQVS